jgi:phage gp29-like protein
VTLTTIAPGSVNYEAFQKLVEYADNSYSIAINGGMMTSIAAANGLGSGAADVQNEVRKEIIETDHRQLESTFSKQLVTPIIRLNFPEIPIGKKFRFQYLKSEDKQVASTTNKTKRVTTPASEVGGENTVK